MSDAWLEEALQHYPLATNGIPLNWAIVALTEIASDVNPGFASGKHSSDGIGLPHMRPMNVDRDGRIDLNLVKSVLVTNGIELALNDVLFNNTNSPELVGKTAVVSDREAGFAFSNHMTRVRLESGISARYIARQLHFLWMTGYMKHRCTNHVNQASISSKTLANGVPIQLPPVAEQDRIVDRLEELLSDLDAGVAELKAAQRKLAQYRQSLLKAAVEGALTTDWRASRAQRSEPQETGAELLQRILIERRAGWERKQRARFSEQGKAPPQDWQAKYSAPVASDTNNLPALPEGWSWATVDQLSFVVRGASPRPAGDPRYFGGSIPWITVGSLTADGDMYLDRVDQFVTEAGRDASRYIEPDTLLLTNSGATLGVPKITRIGGCINDGSVALLDIHEPARTYIYWFLRTQTKKLRALNQGAAQPNLNTDIVRRITVPVCDHVEMAEINAILDQQISNLRNQEEGISRSLKQAAAQRKNILKAAFAGQLVPQDPGDEPASVLLERIRAERAAGANPIRRGRKAKENA